jgi:hypothetical protein
LRGARTIAIPSPIANAGSASSAAFWGSSFCARTTMAIAHIQVMLMALSAMPAANDSCGR